jgi:hypothetical protein
MHIGTAAHVVNYAVPPGSTVQDYLEFIVAYYYLIIVTYFL